MAEIIQEIQDIWNLLQIAMMGDDRDTVLILCNNLIASVNHLQMQVLLQMPDQQILNLGGPNNGPAVQNNQELQQAPVLVPQDEIILPHFFDGHGHDPVPVNPADLYRDNWRGAGQGMVENYTVHRRYYRCRTHGCPARRFVDRLNQEEVRIRYPDGIAEGHTHPPDNP